MVKRRSADSVVHKLAYGLSLVSFSLGTWQVWRWRWKRNVLAQYQEVLSAEPIELDKVDGAIPWAKYRVKGVLDTRNIILVGPRASRIALPPGCKSTNQTFVFAYSVICPLRRDDQTTILINLGLFPYKSFKESLTLNDAKVELEVVPDISEGSSWLSPLKFNENTLGSVTTAKDYAGMAAHLNVKHPNGFRSLCKVSPALTLQDPLLGLLSANKHLEYVGTWYGLAAAILLFSRVF